MLVHAHAGAGEGDEFVKLVATKPIKEGQTITFRYRKGIQRCDGSLFQYGFVEVSERGIPHSCIEFQAEFFFVG